MTARVRAAIYARVSTGGQDPEPQLRELKRYVKARGWDLVGEYVDVAGGKGVPRPNLTRMERDAFRHEFDVVVVWKFDRFARSISHLLRALEQFREHKIEFVSMTEQIDTSTPTGKLIFSVLGAVAELERDTIRERVRLGMAAKRARGMAYTRPLKPIDELKVRRDHAVLKSVRKVAMLHHCSTFTVHRILRGKRLTPISFSESPQHVN